MYAKLFSQIYDGTLCTHGPWEALVTFQQMLVLADKDGCVDMTADAISRRTTIPIEIIRKGIEKLLEPDPNSRTPTAEGRRIIPLSDGRDWGWRVVNYVHYRQIKREHDRREYHREYWRQRRGKQSDDASTDSTDSTNSTDSTKTQQPQPNQPIAYAEAYEKKHPPTPRKRGSGAVEIPGFLEFWAAYPRKQAKPIAQAAYSRLKLDDALQAVLLDALRRQASSEQWRRDGGQFIPLASTWLNQRRWEDEIFGGKSASSDPWAGAL